MADDNNTTESNSNNSNNKSTTTPRKTNIDHEGAAFYDGTSTSSSPSSDASGSGVSPSFAQPTTDDEEKPAPSEVDSVDTQQHIFQRDENGDLIPIADVVKVSGEWQRVEHLPPTKGFLGRVQSRFGGREDIDLAEIDDLMGDFYADPEVRNWDDVSTGLYIPLMQHMVQTIMGGETDDEVMQELRGAVEARQAAGN